MNIAVNRIGSAVTCLITALNNANEAQLTQYTKALCAGYALDWIARAEADLASAKVALAEIRERENRKGAA